MYLIVGGDSVIGKALSSYWQDQGVVHHSSTKHWDRVTEKRPYLDLANQVWPDPEKIFYEAVVFCAAATKLADCEENPDLTWQINVYSTVTLAKLLGLRSSHLTLLSTNQVFDGTRPHRKVSELPCPFNEYGRQKAEAERQIMQLPNSAVLRLTKVVHPDLPLFRRWESSLRAGQPIEVLTDMYIAPISINDVVHRIDLLVQNRDTGIFHLSGEQDVSYYCFAQSYFSYIAGSSALIRKQKSSDSNTDQLSLVTYSSLG